MTLPDAAYSFAGRAYLVTGAASGIGLACAQRLAAGGAARLVLVDRDAAALARVDLGCTLDLLPGTSRTRRCGTKRRRC